MSKNDICLKNLTHCVLLWRSVTQGHRNRHKSIRYLWLPVNVPQQYWAYLVYRFRDKWQF